MCVCVLLVSVSLSLAVLLRLISWASLTWSLLVLILKKGGFCLMGPNDIHIRASIVELVEIECRMFVCDSINLGGASNFWCCWWCYFVFFFQNFFPHSLLINFTLAALQCQKHSHAHVQLYFLFILFFLFLACHMCVCVLWPQSVRESSKLNQINLANLATLIWLNFAKLFKKNKNKKKTRNLFNI